jgi:ABC-type nickel/cobalt efflux system permease component RcnA
LAAAAAVLVVLLAVLLVMTAVRGRVAQQQQQQQAQHTRAPQLPAARNDLAGPMLQQQVMQQGALVYQQPNRHMQLGRGVRQLNDAAHLQHVARQQQRQQAGPAWVRMTHGCRL